MDDEYHITRLIGKDGILVARCIVEEQFDVVHGFFGGLAWLDTMELSAVSIVESTDRPWYKKVPRTCWM